MRPCAVTTCGLSTSGRWCRKHGTKARRRLNARKRSRRATARFFVRIGQRSRERWRDENTAQLFSLAQYMDCEGLLASGARHLVR